MKSLKLSKYFEITHPEYVCLQIIPSTNSRNYNTSEITTTFVRMYKSINKRIKLDNKKFIIEGTMKSCYIIDIFKKVVSFYLIIPKQYSTIIKEKVKEVWNGCGVLETPMITIDNDIIYQLKYKNLDSFSLYINKKTNQQIDGLLNIVDILKDTDRISIVYNFIPMSSYGWQSTCDNAFLKLKNNESIKKELSGITIIFESLFKILEFINEVIENLLGKTTNKEMNPLNDFIEILRNNDRKPSEFSMKKKYDYIIGTQMLICANNKDLENEVFSICNSYQKLSNDNELICEKIHTNPKLLNVKFNNVEINRCSVTETQNFIQLPSKEILEKLKDNTQYKNVTESVTPKELQKGIVRLGVNIKDNIMTYLSTDKELQYLTLCIIAATRSGKTTYITNMCYDYINNNECNIVFDWCGKCEMTLELQKAFPNKVTIIDCSNPKTLQGIGYNELFSTTNSEFEQYRSAKHQASQLLTLINSVTGGDEDLRSRMERYLSSACILVAFKNGSARDVFKVLQDYKTRHNYIDFAQSKFPSSSEEHIENLLELDKGKEDTNITAIQGILNRVNKLKENIYMELMLKKDCSNNFNLVDMLQKPQIICIKMPERMFNTQQEKDTYATYWFTKVWCALQQRQWFFEDKQMRKVNLFFDELYQTPNLQLLLKNKLSQIAKFRAKPIITCHSLKQINGIKDELKSANASYMLISGADTSNYSELKQQLLPYTEEDIVNLKRYHSLNLIKCNSGYAKFITQLPKPI